MARVLRTDVYVGGERYAAGSTPADHVARRITNPHAWEDTVDPNGEPVGEGTQIHADPDPGPGAPQPRTDAPDPDTTVDLSPQRGAPKAPPRSGKGSGIDAWEAFAAANGVALPAGTYGRDDVIAACEDAGVIDPA